MAQTLLESFYYMRFSAFEHANEEVAKKKVPPSVREDVEWGKPPPRLHVPWRYSAYYRRGSFREGYFDVLILNFSFKIPITFPKGSRPAQGKCPLL